MKISKSSSYGLHALMYMVRHITLLPVTCKEMAKAEGISSGCLAKILQKFVSVGIIKSNKRIDGGYEFGRPPEEINLLEIIEAIEDRQLFHECLLKHCECSGTLKNCEIYRVWYETTNVFREFLEQIKLAELAWKHPEHNFINKDAVKSDTAKADHKIIS